MIRCSHRQFIFRPSCWLAFPLCYIILSTGSAPNDHSDTEGQHLLSAAERIRLWRMNSKEARGFALNENSPGGTTDAESSHSPKQWLLPPPAPLNTPPSPSPELASIPEVCSSRTGKPAIIFWTPPSHCSRISSKDGDHAFLFKFVPSSIW